MERIKKIRATISREKDTLRLPLRMCMSVAMEARRAIFQRDKVNSLGERFWPKKNTQQNLFASRHTIRLSNGHRHSNKSLLLWILLTHERCPHKEIRNEKRNETKQSLKVEIAVCIWRVCRCVCDFVSLTKWRRHSPLQWTYIAVIAGWHLLCVPLLPRCSWPLARIAFHYVFFFRSAFRSVYKRWLLFFRNCTCLRVLWVGCAV